MYIFDNNFIIDILVNRKGFADKYLDIFLYCLKKEIGYAATSQIDNLRYVIKKEYSQYFEQYLLVEKKLKIAKTPTNISFDNPLAKLDFEDYLIELSAISLDAKIISSDKKFLASSNYTIKAEDFYAYEKNRPKKIDFANLKKQYLMYQPELEQEMDKVLNTASYIMGDSVKVLEASLEAFTGAKYAITCGSGTDALLLAMMALDIKPGDEIITTPFTFIATAETIAFLKAKPVFVDIDEKTYNIDASKIEEKITAKTKAIMPVSLYGQPADMDKIQNIASKHNLKVIIDGAQSFGSIYKGKTDSNLGDISATSFFPAKPLGCFGDGGAVFTNDDALAEKMRSLRVHGQSKRYHHQYIGMGGRMDTLQAAVLNVKLKHYEKDLVLRQEVAEKYNKVLSQKYQVSSKESTTSNLQLQTSNLELPTVLPDRTSVWAQYSIRITSSNLPRQEIPLRCKLETSDSARSELEAKLKDAGIPTAVHYPMPLHLQECFEYLGYKQGDFPVAEQVSTEIMSLPMNPYLSNEEIEYITECL